MDDKSILDQILELALSWFSKKEVGVQINIPLSPQTRSEPEEPASEIKKDEYVLTHTIFGEDGIFGELKKNGIFIAYTLEHSYGNKPKLADGSYTCVRGPHRLHGMTADFITFEIMGVPNFDGKPVTGVLFHWGNYNKDSEGCVLMGSGETPKMITSSKDTWSSFMDSLVGIDSFQLTVISASQQ